MMSFQRQVSRTLDEEHRTNLDLLRRVELAFGRAAHSGATLDPELGRLLASLGNHIEQDLWPHFDFEETELFPRLEAAGDGDIADLLREEHAAIREVVAELMPLASAAVGGTLDGERWNALKRAALEMVERLVAHIQKETMALLPLVDDLLDDDTDRELAFRYATA